MRPISQMTWFKDNVKENDVYDWEIDRDISGMSLLIYKNVLKRQQV